MSWTPITGPGGVWSDTTGFDQILAESGECLMDETTGECFLMESGPSVNPWSSIASPSTIWSTP